MAQAEASPAAPLKIPDYDDLPLVPDHFERCAWGVFDRDAVKDKFGTLNFLTPQVVAAAAGEVKDGISISLNWPLNAPQDPMTRVRECGSHNIIQWPNPDNGRPLPVFDDELHFNTQTSSQWDSLCHFSHMASGLTYNNTRTDADVLSSLATTAENPMPTLDHWHARGGVVGRGVLIDFKAYVDDKGIEFDVFGTHRITVQEIEAVAAHQGTEIREGDILIVRLGFMEITDEFARDPSSFAGRKVGGLLDGGSMSGVHGAKETVRWLWNKKIAAVAGDSVCFEAFPSVDEDGSPPSVKQLYLHQHLLALLGMPIGELWDLRKLSRYCKEKGRYSFFLTSVPLNHPGLIGSPPNALAVF